MAGKKKHLSCFQLAVSVLLFYWFPFLREDPDAFLRGYNYYTYATLWEWKKYEPDVFWHLGNGLGFTQLWYKLTPRMDVATRLSLYKLIHLGACAIALAGCLFFALRNKNKISRSAALLFSLKVYLSVFYAFIQIPYKYLFIVPVMISATLLMDAHRSSPPIRT